MLPTSCRLYLSPCQLRLLLSALSVARTVHLGAPHLGWNGGEGPAAFFLFRRSEWSLMTRHGGAQRRWRAAPGSSQDLVCDAVAWSLPAPMRLLSAGSRVPRPPRSVDLRSCVAHSPTPRLVCVACYNTGFGDWPWNIEVFGTFERREAEGGKADRKENFKDARPGPDCRRKVAHLEVASTQEEPGHGMPCPERQGTYFPAKRDKVPPRQFGNRALVPAIIRRMRSS